MLDIQLDIEGDAELIRALNHLEGNATKVIQRGLRKAARGIERLAHEKLSGPGARASNVEPGGYPVPVRTGNLRSLLYLVPPGKTKSVKDSQGNIVDAVTAGVLQAIIGDSAEYADVIHDGILSSADYGPRPFMTDAVEEYDRSPGVGHIIAEELENEIRRLRLNG